MALDQISGSSLRAHWAWPLVQRACCARHAAAVCGNSPGTTRSGHHGAAPALHHAAHGKVQVFGQGVAGPAAALFDGGAVPHAGAAVEGHRQAGAEARFLLHREMGIQQQALHPRQPVGVAVGMAPARLHKGQAAVGQQRRHGAAQEIGRRHEIGIEDRHIGRVGMGKAEGQIAGLETLAVAAPQDLEIDAFRHHAAHRGGQRVMALAVAVIQQLDGEAVARPVHARQAAAATRTARWPSLQTGKLHQHMRQLGVADGSAQLELRALAEHAHPGQHRQLDRQRADGDQDEAEGELQELGKTVHGESFRPPRLLSRPESGRSGIYGPAGSSTRGLPPAACAAARTGRTDLLMPGQLLARGLEAKHPA